MVDGHIELEMVDTVTYKADKIVMSRMGELVIFDSFGINKGRFQVPYGSILRVENQAKVQKGDVLFEWDPYNSPIISSVSGKVQFLDLQENATYRVEKDEVTDVESWIIISDKRGKRRPAISIIDASGNKVGHFMLPDSAILSVSDKDDVTIGQTLAKLPRAVGKLEILQVVCLEWLNFLKLVFLKIPLSLHLLMVLLATVMKNVTIKK